MFFEDLTLYSYFEHYTRPGLLNVGWLDVARAFPRQVPSARFVESLWGYYGHRIAQARGFQPCEFCDPPSKGLTVVTFQDCTLRLGFAEIRVFTRTGEAFAAPDLVFHYVLAHHYAPPARFVDAVLSGPRPGTLRYTVLLEEHAGEADRRRIWGP